MHSNFTLARLSRQSKRARLTELVRRLGADATPAQIREHAYREGIGQVHGYMLCSVRNELWPDRAKRAGNPSAHRPTRILGPEPEYMVIRCPECSSARGRYIGNYHRRTDGTILVRRKCMECGHRWSSEREAGKRHIHARRLAAMVATEKECSKCRRVLPVASFGKKAGGSVLYRSACKECLNAARREHYYTREIKRDYGLTAELYQEMLERQGGFCAICRQPEGGKRGDRGFLLAVDHCHATNRVRGLLCSKCNLGIGNFNEDIARLEAAISYLREHQGGASRTDRT